MRGLYAIVDVGVLASRGLPVCPFAEAVLAAKPAAIQLRDKTGGARRVLDVLRALRPAASAAGVPLFANDRPDLALLAGCDGVHVGQDDLPPGLVRELAARSGRSLLVGLSTHDEAELDAALDEPIDYVALGPVFATASKERPDPVLGLARLAALAARARARRPGLPVVAIGGITLASAGGVGAVCDAVAAIGALLPDASGTRALDEVSERARALHAAAVETARRAAPPAG